MSLKCAIGVHEWSGCECQRCGKTRDEGHDWTADCEKCHRCGKTRDQGHDWSVYCVRCSKCPATRTQATTTLLSFLTTRESVSESSPFGGTALAPRYSVTCRERATDAVVALVQQSPVSAASALLRIYTDLVQGEVVVGDANTRNEYSAFLKNIMIDMAKRDSSPFVALLSNTDPFLLGNASEILKTSGYAPDSENTKTSRHAPDSRAANIPFLIANGDSDELVKIGAPAVPFLLSHVKAVADPWCDTLSSIHMETLGAIGGEEARAGLRRMLEAKESKGIFDLSTANVLARCMDAACLEFVLRLLLLNTSIQIELYPEDFSNQCDSKGLVVSPYGPELRVSIINACSRVDRARTIELLQAWQHNTEFQAAAAKDASKGMISRRVSPQNVARIVDILLIHVQSGETL